MSYLDLPWLVVGLIIAAFGEVLLYVAAGLAVIAAVGWWIWKD